MFLKIVAEMTTKNKGYSNYSSADFIALFTSLSPILSIRLRSPSDVPPQTPYLVNSGCSSAYFRHFAKTGHFRHIDLAASVASVFLTPLKSWPGLFGFS